MTSHSTFNLNHTHPTWRLHIDDALKKMDQCYLQQILLKTDWLPGPDKIFNAFSLSFNDTKYILFGESPYPRLTSANGYAFWDQCVAELWSKTGLSKKVNRATSLRNIIKMLLVAESLTDPRCTNQTAIACIDKNKLVQTNQELFTNLIGHGFLLLNASLVFELGKVQEHAKAWQPFIAHILYVLFKENPHLKLLLFGKIANTIDKLVNNHEGEKIVAEHPYNISFITNPKVIEFFKPLHLLRSRKE